jgi:hypothetical protein
MSSNVLSSELERLLTCWLALDEALDTTHGESEGLWNYIEESPDLADQTRKALGLERGEAFKNWPQAFIGERVEDFVASSV